MARFVQRAAPVVAESTMKEKKRYVACNADDLPPGERLVVDCGGRSVGVFNVRGRFWALLNRCPHYAGPLCLGILSGTAVSTDATTYEYGREEMILRCPWHGWEFDIESGQCLAEARIKARAYEVAVENGDVVVYI